MRTGFIIAALAVSTLFISSCVQKEYYTVEPPPAEPPGPQYNYIFDDDFNNNINNWTFSDPDNAAYVTMVNSWLKYTYMPPNDGTNTVAISTGAKLHRNFLVQTRIRSDYAMGLCFGVSDNDYGYSFFIDNDGYFALYREGTANEGVQTIMDWQASEAIYRNGWNEVEFEQTGNYWMGYINGVKVFEIPAKSINGNKIGYIVLAGTTGYADYLTVQW
ncbi:MAG: hypothetical protein H3C54_12005 [Taibaiella sp.]|nr:hypothetical protein [Taibaiella sp.]